MKLKGLFIILFIPFLLSSCSGRDKLKDQAIADEIANTAAIAQVSSGRDGSHILFSGEKGENTIYKPYTPPRGSTEKQIFTSTLILSTWFKLDENSEEKAYLEWTFDDPSYIIVTPPSSDLLPHETVSFVKYPEYGQIINLLLTGEITYFSGKSKVIYNISLYNTNPNDKK